MMHGYTKEGIIKTLKAIIIIAIIVIILRWFSYTFGMESKQRYLEENAFEYVVDVQYDKLDEYINDHEDYYQDKLDKAYKSGHDDGYSEGYTQGFAAAIEEAEAQGFEYDGIY